MAPAELVVAANSGVGAAAAAAAASIWPVSVATSSAAAAIDSSEGASAGDSLNNFAGCDFAPRASCSHNCRRANERSCTCVKSLVWPGAHTSAASSAVVGAIRSAHCVGVRGKAATSSSAARIAARSGRSDSSMLVPALRTLEKR